MLIISDLSHEENTKYIKDIENCKIYDSNTAEIKKCMGCFNCWVKTPGCCIINDLSRKINEDAIKSNNLIIITKITYGGYSPYIKNILDRMIPNILPYFKIINKEVHHAPRYSSYPNLTVIGYGHNLLNEEQDLFVNIVKANATNMQNHKYNAIIIKNKEEITNIITSIGGNENE